MINAPVSSFLHKTTFLSQTPRENFHPGLIQDAEEFMTLIQDIINESVLSLQLYLFDISLKHLSSDDKVSSSVRLSLYCDCVKYLH